jgi:hypothetical protein
MVFTESAIFFGNRDVAAATIESVDADLLSVAAAGIPAAGRCSLLAFLGGGLLPTLYNKATNNIAEDMVR